MRAQTPPPPRSSAQEQQELLVQHTEQIRLQDTGDLCGEEKAAAVALPLLKMTSPGARENVSRSVFFFSSLSLLFLIFLPCCEERCPQRAGAAAALLPLIHSKQAEAGDGKIPIVMLLLMMATQSSRVCPSKTTATRVRPRTSLVFPLALPPAHRELSLLSHKLQWQDQHLEEEREGGAGRPQPQQLPQDQRALLPHHRIFKTSRRYLSLRM